MKFQTKILVVTLSILILTLVMNSVLSLASFEKVYVRSQISTYELICKDLKRKIERSLRFGKPLEKFNNMDKLLQETLALNPDISAISISDMNGIVLYHTREKKIGTDISKMIPVLDAKTPVKSYLKDNQYHSFIGIQDRTKQQVGVIGLTFSRQIIFKKLKSMANKNFTMLWVLMILTSITLVFLLAFLIMRPINSQVLEMKARLEQKGHAEDDTADREQNKKNHNRHYLKEGVPDTMDEEIISGYLQLSTVRNEIDRLGVNIEAFANSISNSMEKMNGLYKEQDQFAAACREFQETYQSIKQTITQIGLDPNQLFEDEKCRLEQLQNSLDHLVTFLKTLNHATDLRIDLEKLPDPDNTLSESDIG